MKISKNIPRFGLIDGVIICLGILMAGCSTPPPGRYDPEIKVSAEAAQAAFQRGEVARADALYVKALARARRESRSAEVSRLSSRKKIPAPTKATWVAR